MREEIICEGESEGLRRELKGTKGKKESVQAILAQDGSSSRSLRKLCFDFMLRPKFAEFC